MKLLADQNVPEVSVNILKQTGFSIKYMERSHSGKTDKEVLEIAQKEKRIIITFDQDFANISARSGLLPDSGIIAIKLFEFNAEYPAKLLVRLFKATDLNFEGYYTVVGNDYIFQRKFS